MTIYVINPNSSETVTRGIAEAVDGRAPAHLPVICLSLSEGPPGIETDAHVNAAADHVSARAARLVDASAIVIACFSDPGVARLRGETALPVLGIRESAVTRALTLGRRFGVIAMGEASVRRHLAAFDEMGVMDRLAGDRPLGLSVPDLADPAKTRDRMIATALTLRDADDADVLILGCAGMPRYRAEIEAATGLPVVEPCQAAVDLAVERITLAATKIPET